MKAWLSRTAGPPESLAFEETKDPEPNAGEVLIRVAACAANFPDLLMVADKYQFRPLRPFTPGAEVAGIVEKVGSGVTGFAAGDRVMATCSVGGMAEKVAVEESKCLHVPLTMPLDVAAALQMTYGTAHYALTACAQLRAGQTVLVLGAAGGVGLAAVELAKALQARVIAAVSSAEKADVALAHGADQAVVYSRDALDRAARRELAARFSEAGASKPDIVIDPVGGDYSEAALRSIRSGGVHVVIGFAAGVSCIPLNLVLLNNARIVGAPWGAVVAQDADQFKQVLEKLMELYDQNLIRPHISIRLPFREGWKALRALEQRTAIGKIMIEIGMDIMA